MVKYITTLKITFDMILYDRDAQKHLMNEKFEFKDLKNHTNSNFITVEFNISHSPFTLP